MPDVISNLEYNVLARNACEYSGITIEDLHGPSRSPAAIQTRRMIWLNLSDRGHFCTQIARMARRDHSTVLHGINKAKRDPLLASLARQLEQGLIPVDRPGRLGAYGPTIAGAVNCY